MTQFDGQSALALAAALACAACTHFSAATDPPASLDGASVDAGPGAAPSLSPAPTPNAAPAPDAGTSTDPAPHARTAFLTSALYRPGYDLHDLASADALCNAEAAASSNAAIRAAHFTAWLSTYDSWASARIAPSDKRVVNTHGDVIAYGWGDLVDGAISAPIAFDADGNDATLVSHAVWTATLASGEFLDSDCSPTWTATSSANNAVIGDATATDERWSGTSIARKSCNESAHLYCFED